MKRAEKSYFFWMYNVITINEISFHFLSLSHAYGLEISTQPRGMQCSLLPVNDIKSYTTISFYAMK